MTPWLKKRTPEGGPGAPPHVDHQMLLEQLASQRALGVNSPAIAYLWAMTPATELDEWGQPLPISSMQQDALDRLVAILQSPFERSKALLHAGQLAPDEVDAVAAAFPDLYGMLIDRARTDMIETPLPFPAWAEAQLSILFRKPASVVYAPTKEQDDASAGPEAMLKSPLGTQADRRELAVREKRS